MRTYRLVTTLLLVIPLLTAAWLPAAANPSGNQRQILALDKIEPLVLEELATHTQTDFFIWMAEQADLSPAYLLQTKQARGRFVFDTLRQTAQQTQGELRRFLDAQGVEWQPFYIANKILVRGGGRALALQVAADPRVSRLTANHRYQLDEPKVHVPLAQQPLGVEANVSFVHADDVWAMGYDGAGMVVANNDTGLDWDHPALIDHYRGWNGTTANHNYNWWDATGTYPSSPADGHSHGTHTTGTMVGDDGGSNRIGMAPGARTIHCKNMYDIGWGNDDTFSTCLQWDLAPWDLNGQNPDPDLAPDAINNSWGYFSPTGQFKDEIAALHAAGILVEASAGNSGSGCSTLISPGDYAEVLTTGAVYHSSAYPGTLWGPSSRGPSTLDPGYFPDVVAPGVNIRSAMPGGGYGFKTGTSMAGPHTVGLVALIWSACPDLRGQVQPTMQIIQDTAAPLTGQLGSSCGGDYVDGPNHDWGHGTIDALAAVQAAIDACGDLPPSVSVANPPDGSTVSGTVALQIGASDAEDAAGTLAVEWSVDDGAWQPATYNDGTGTYEATWDTTAVGDGEHGLTARAQDSAGNTDTHSHTLTVENVNSAPVVNDVSDSTLEDTPDTWYPDYSDGDGDTLSCMADETSVQGGLVTVAVDCSSGTYDPSPDYSGLDSFTYSACDPGGLCDSGTVTYDVAAMNDAPVASFSYACTGLACDFDASGSNDGDGSIVSYGWDFGDQSPASSGETTSHTYATAGTYLVTLTVTDDGDAWDTEVQSVSVAETPPSMHVGDLDGSLANANKKFWWAEVTITVHDQAENPVLEATVTGAWSGGVAGSGTCLTDATGTCSVLSDKIGQSEPSVTFTLDSLSHAALPYAPSANHDPDGDSDGSSLVVSRAGNQAPVASFMFNCPDLSCQFDASDSYDPDGTLVRYDWEFGDEGSAADAGPSVSHSYAAPGVYTVILTVTDNDGAQDTDTQGVPVGVSPGTLFVYDIAMSGRVAGPHRSATAQVTMRDTDGNPVAGATVYGTWSGDYSATVSGTTDALGTVSFTSGKVRQASATFTFTVDDVVKSGYPYDPELNNETTDTIVVR
jgi:PKD repeat protein